MSQDFSVIYKSASPFGVIVGVSIPEPKRISDNHWKRLHKAEQQAADTYSGIRKMTYVGGRLAVKNAFQLLNVRSQPVINSENGAPVASAGTNISITHKKNVAYALVSKKNNTSVGIDFETLLPNRNGIASKVLTDQELAFQATLPQELQWQHTLVAFSTKESVYKALQPRLNHYIGFDEAVVEVKQTYETIVTLQLKERDHLPKTTRILGLRARHKWFDHGILTSVEAQWLGA